MGLVKEQAASRLFAADESIYREEFRAAAATRLGWVDFAAHAAESIELAERASTEVFGPAGVRRVVLCGMGGSGLAPAVIAQWAGAELVLADTTNPAFLSRESSRDLRDTLIICSSKSGTTVETTSHIALFRAALLSQGLSPAEHMLFITDPGTPLAAQAVAAGEQCILGKPTVGGRFSALTAFGLVPAVLCGAPAAQLVQEAQSTVPLLAADTVANPAVQLAQVLTAGLPAQYVLELVPEDTTAHALGMWIEQLIAESTGKHGKGILPVTLRVGEELSAPLPQVRRVRLSVASPDSAETELAVAVGEAASEVSVKGSLGAHFLLWEVVTAFLGVLLEIDPFDQPDVESAKKAARENLTGLSTNFEAVGLQGANASLVTVPGEPALASVEELLSEIRKSAADGYLVVQAYVDMTAENEKLLSELRTKLSRDLGVPVAQAFGPRYLHSTGQFHKGGPAVGTFLQIVDAGTSTLEIPGQEYDYTQLLTAQAAGDAAVLRGLGKRVFTLQAAAAPELLAQLLAA